MIPAAVLVLTLAVPLFGESDFDQGECGKFSPNATPVHSAISGAPVLKGQWPWHVTIFLNLGAGEKYFSSGTLVSRRHIITAAIDFIRLRTKNVTDENLFTLYVGKYNISNPHDGMPLSLLKNITIHPEYNANRANNLAIIELWEDVNWDWVQPACLWPEELTDFSNIINRSGSVIGWGYDYKLGRSNTEILTQMQLPVVSRETCVELDKDFYTATLPNLAYCAGNKDGVTTRNINIGQGMVFNNGGLWYLRGLVANYAVTYNSQSCDPTYYIIFTDIAKYLPWIRENMNI